MAKWKYEYLVNCAYTKPSYIGPGSLTTLVTLTYKLDSIENVIYAAKRIKEEATGLADAENFCINNFIFLRKYRSRKEK